MTFAKRENRLRHCQQRADADQPFPTHDIAVPLPQQSPESRPAAFPLRVGRANAVESLDLVESRHWRKVV